MMKKVSLDQRRKVLFAGGFFLLAVMALLYSVFGGSDSPAPRPATPPPPSDRIAAKDLEKVRAQQPLPSPAPVEGDGGLLDRFAQLNLSGGPPTPSPDGNRNVFAYPPPPPPKPTPPPPPPPLTLTGIAPNTFYGRTSQTCDIAVQGPNLREGLQIYFDGVPLPSKFVNGSLQATLTPNLTSNPRQATVLVKDPANPEKTYSSSVSFQIMDPPKPTVQFIGMIAERGGKNPSAIITGTNADERKVVRQGSIVSDRFRVVSVSRTGIILEDTRLAGVPQYTIQLQDTGNSTGGGGFGSSYTPPQGASNNAYPQYNQQYTLQYNQTNGYVPPGSQQFNQSGQQTGSGFASEEDARRAMESGAFQPPQPQSPQQQQKFERTVFTDANGNPITREEMMRRRAEQERLNRRMRNN